MLLLLLSSVTINSHRRSTTNVEIYLLYLLISPHGIAMSKGLYVTAVFSSSIFFFFRRLISEVTERILIKLGHIFTYDCYLKNLFRTPRAFTPTSWGHKAAFLGPTLNKDNTGGL